MKPIRSAAWPADRSCLEAGSGAGFNLLCGSQPATCLLFICFHQREKHRAKAFRMARVEKNQSLEAPRLLFPLNNGVLLQRSPGTGSWNLGRRPQHPFQREFRPLPPLVGRQPVDGVTALGPGRVSSSDPSSTVWLLSLDFLHVA